MTTPFEQRVLRMRAGIAGRASSRRETAQRLRTTPDRIGKAERSGLRRLREASESGVCESRGYAVGHAIAEGGLTVAASGGSAPGDVPASGDRAEVLGVSRSSEEAGESSESPVGAIGPASEEASEVGGLAEPLLVWLGALMLLAAVGATVLLARRGRAVEPSPLEKPEDLPPAPWASYDDRAK